MSKAVMKGDADYHMRGNSFWRGQDVELPNNYFFSPPTELSSIFPNTRLWEYLSFFNTFLSE
jgi:hypothetical protein